MSWKGALASIAIIFIAAVAVMGYQALTATKTFDGKWMTFEYANYLNVTEYDPPGEEGVEYVILRDFEGDAILVIATDSPPEFAELVLANLSAEYGTELQGPSREDVDGVTCRFYYDDTLDKCAYIFEKQGMTFVVFSHVTLSDESENIIKSIKPK